MQQCWIPHQAIVQGVTKDKTMTKSIVFILLLTSVSAQASDLKAYFIDKGGKVISVKEAISMSEQEPVYRCQPVKASVNKAGTGVTFKVVKAND
jgi:hypothetical protein